MKILVMGAGALGGYFGSRLAVAGHQVTFVARGKHLEAMRSEGLRIISGVAPAHLQLADFTDEPSAALQPEFVLVAVKLWDTEEAARTLARVVAPQTTIVSFQNGVDAAERLAAILGEEKVIGGVAYISASIETPGVIHHVGTLQRLLVGELRGGVSARVNALADACRGAGIDCVADQDVRRAMWEKFVFLVGVSAVTTLLRCSIGPIRSNPQSLGLLREIMTEVVAVGRAKGIALSAPLVASTIALVETLPPTMVSSMFVDLQRKRRLELPWLSGRVVGLGKELGVPTPANQFVVDALSLFAEGTDAQAGGPQ